MTPEERRLWYDYLKNQPYTVRRQYILGDYIVDFFIPQYKIVIELDGSQHMSEEGKRHDGIRDKYLAENGITVLRYSNSDINKKFHSVCKNISLIIKSKAEET